MAKQSNKDTIISYNQYLCKSEPFDRLKSIKKRNNALRFEYYHLANKYKHLQKNLITFTYMDCDKFSKLDMINDIRNYFNKLVKNTKNDNIKFFSNIELGEFNENPHVHIQVWHDNQKQIDKIYDKVISRFGLFIEFCDLSKSKNDTKIFEYAIKDYNKNMTDEQLLKLDDAKRIFRGVCDKKYRFSSHSKGKYTKAIYKSLYSKFDLKKDTVDLMLDNCIIDIHGNINSGVIEFLYVIICFLSQIDNKSNSIECFECGYKEFQYLILFEWWVYGKYKRI